MGFFSFFAFLFGGRPGGFCCKDCRFFSKFLCRRPILFFLLPISIARKDINVVMIALHHPIMVGLLADT